MLKNALDEIGSIVLLRSDTMLVALAKGRSDELSDLAKGELRDFYPSHFRIESIDAITKARHYDRWQRELDYTFLGELFERFFAQAPYAERLFCKTDALQAYSGVINKIHPYTILGYRISRWLHEGQIGLQEIVRYADFITPLALPIPEDKRDYADMHLHAGGANENILNLWELISGPTPKDFYDASFMRKLPRLTEFSLLNSGSLTIGQVVDAAKLAIQIMKAKIFGHQEQVVLWQRRLKESMQSAFVSKLYSHRHLERVVITHEIYAPVGLGEVGWFWCEAVARLRQGDYNGFWLVWHTMFFVLLESTRESAVKRSVAIFLHAAHILRAYQLMSQNVGLGHFSEFFGSKIRQTTSKRHHNIARNIFLTGTSLVEVKVSPGVFRQGGDALAYCEAFNEVLIQNETKDSESRYHFSLHFVRQEDDTLIKKQGDSGEDQAFKIQPSRHFKLRKKLLKEAKKLHVLLFESGESFVLRDRKDPLNEQKVLRYDPAQMVATIDAAGKESRTPPEVFAPVINYLRYEPKRYRWPQALKAHRQGRLPRKRLKLSMHAGEDFNHIATGIRRIDESLEFYGMQEGDRLGHALAVGIDPRQWLERNGPVYLPKEELLDTLVWLREWGYKVSPFFSKAAKLVKKYETGIRELYGELYARRCDQEVDYDKLYEAWKLRRYCPIVSLSSLKIEVGVYRWVAGIPDGADEVAKRLYHCYHLNRSEKWYEIVRLDYRPSVGYENDWKSITDEDLELFVAIQDALLQKIADRRVVIETNPSSNVYIAMLNGYDEHPIFRWSPVEEFSQKEQKLYNRFGIRNSKVEVCVNTDDPAIFPTTLYTEFLHLRNGAEKLGYPMPVIDRWLDAIRRKGMEIFRQSHEDFKIA